MPTQAAIEKAAAIYAQGLRAAAQMTPREQAEAAWYPGAPKTVEQLEDQIRERRGMTPIDRSGMAG